MNKKDKTYLLMLLNDELALFEEMGNKDNWKQPGIDRLDRIINELNDVL